MNSTSVKIGFIIPFFGGNNYLPKLIHSIYFENNNWDLHVYIIDNSKPHERVNKSLITSHNVHIIDSFVAIGYGAACNIGYKRCKADGCDLLVVVNQDGYFARGSIQLMINTLLKEDEYSVAVPLLTKYENDEVEWFFTHVYLTPMEGLVSDLFRGRIRDFYRINQLCGACFSLKIKDYNGFDYLFDELFYMYFEDNDLYKRLERMKRNVMLVPGAIFHHTHGNTTNYEKETLKGLVIRRTSKHIYTLKQSNRGMFIAFISLIFLIYRNIIAHLFSLNFKDLIVEVWSFFAVSIKMGKIFSIMRKERLQLL